MHFIGWGGEVLDSSRFLLILQDGVFPKPTPTYIFRALQAHHLTKCIITCPQDSSTIGLSIQLCSRNIQKFFHPFLIFTKKIISNQSTIITIYSSQNFNVLQMYLMYSIGNRLVLLCYFISNVVVKLTYNLDFIIFRVVMMQMAILLLHKINHHSSWESHQEICRLQFFFSFFFFFGWFQDYLVILHYKTRGSKF